MPSGRHGRDRGNPEIRAQRIKGPAGKVEDFLHPENQLQAGGNEEQDGGMEQAAQHDIKPRRQTLPSRLHPSRLRPPG